MHRGGFARLGHSACHVCHRNVIPGVVIGVWLAYEESAGPSARRANAGALAGFLRRARLMCRLYGPLSKIGLSRPLIGGSRALDRYNIEAGVAGCLFGA